MATILIAACEREENIRPFQTRSVSAIVDALEDTYIKNSQKDYKDILDDWHNNIPPKSFDSLDTEIERDIYKIFQAIYNPFDINRLGDHEWGELYEGYDYTVVQNYVYYNYTYNSDNHEGRDSIGDFRPEIYLEGKTILYLEPEYHEAIYTFLGTEYSPLGTRRYHESGFPNGRVAKTS